MTKKTFFSQHKPVQDACELAGQLYHHSGLVVITGQTGTGKTFLAKQLHLERHKNIASFIEQSATSLSPQQFTSQLFGHLKGAFSDATRDYPGLIGLAENGTLCLDHLSLLPREIQAGLLRFLQEKKYRPLGSNREQTFTGKIVLTSSETIDQLIGNGTFREDFAFRIQSHIVNLPSLAARPRDFNLFLDQFFQEVQSELGTDITCDPNAFKPFIGKHLSGNLHELRGMVLQYVLAGKTPTALLLKKPDKEVFALPQTESLKTDLKVLEKQLLKRALGMHFEDMTELARHLAMSRRSLFYKLKEHGLN